MFTVEEACLVVVDVQGKLATIVDESEATIANIAKLIQAIQDVLIMIRPKIIFADTEISAEISYFWGEKFQKLKVKWILFST